MGGKGGSGAVPTNDQLVQMQMQQAQQASLSNADLQARLQQGVKEINQLFQGTPSGSSMLDLSSIANASPYTGGLPSANAAPVFPVAQPAPSAAQIAAANTAATGYSSRYTGGASTPPASATASTPSYAARYSGGASTGNTVAPQGARTTGYGGQLGNGYSWGVLGDTGGGTPMYGIYDASGNLVTDASSLSDLSKAKIAIGGDPSQTTGGFGSDFYNTYQNSILGYYLPQEDQQYNNARTQLNYNLARAGQLNSGTAGKDIADLAQQDINNRANIASNADQQTGALRTSVAQNQQTALNQLYSTENPSVAANTAENMVANAQLTKPLLNPAGALFNVASVGVGNALSGFTNPYAYINPSAGGLGQLTTTGAGATTTGAAGSGGTVSG